MAETLIARRCGDVDVAGVGDAAISRNMDLKVSTAWTAVNGFSFFEVIQVCAWGVDMMGRSRRRESSTKRSKWSLAHTTVVR